MQSAGLGTTRVTGIYGAASSTLAVGRILIQSCSKPFSDGGHKIKQFFNLFMCWQISRSCVLGRNSLCKEYIIDIFVLIFGLFYIKLITSDLTPIASSTSDCFSKILTRTDAHKGFDGPFRCLDYRRASKENGDEKNSRQKF